MVYFRIDSAYRATTEDFVGQAILPAAAFQAALSGHASVSHQTSAG
jgi:hypothetical protein